MTDREVIGWMLVTVLFVAGFIVCLVYEPEPPRPNRLAHEEPIGTLFLHPDASPARSAEGPGGYLDHKENQRRNMVQTGVHDRQIPLDMRQNYARDKGLQVPTD